MLSGTINTSVQWQSNTASTPDTTDVAVVVEPTLSCQQDFASDWIYYNAHCPTLSENYDESSETYFLDYLEAPGWSNWADPFAYVLGSTAKQHVFVLDTTQSASLPELKFSLKGSGNPPEGYTAKGFPYWGNTSLDLSFKATLAQVIALYATSTGSISVTASANYFSGTDCTVYCPVGVPAGATITNAEVSVNGTPVDTYISSTSSSGIVLAATFDSTHFMNGTKADVEAVVSDSAGNTYASKLGTPAAGTAGFSVYTKNRAYAIANASFRTAYINEAVNGFVSNIKAANYFATQTNSDNGAEILSTLPLYTAFYGNVHSAGGVFEDCIGDTEISYFDIGTALAPPSKPTNVPPMNFVFIDACETMESPYMSSDFLEGAPESDRAVVGWTNEVFTSLNNAAFVNGLMAELCNGYSLNTSVLMA